jgi:hypothetical protein
MTPNGATAEPRGRFRRRVACDRIDAATTVARLEDDFHHFEVTIRHAAGRVTAVDGVAVRHPWTLCPSAAARLEDLVGCALPGTLADALALGHVRSNCTHMYDLACLAMTGAARGVSGRWYDMTVEDRRQGWTTARLTRDDGLQLTWLVHDDRLVVPDPGAAVSLKGDFVKRVGGVLEPDRAEAAILLRRAVFVSGGRRRNLDLARTAADGARNLGGCFVMQPGVAEKALRVRGSTRDFSGTQEQMLAAAASPGGSEAEHRLQIGPTDLQ